MTERQSVGKSRILQGLPRCAKGGTRFGVLIGGLIFVRGAE